jgi:hypothetical protein
MVSSRGRLGAAYYDASQYKLFLAEDAEDSVPFDLTTMCMAHDWQTLHSISSDDRSSVLEQTQPRSLLLGSHSDYRFIEHVQKACSSESTTTFQLRPSSEFNSMRGRALLTKILNRSVISGEGASRLEGNDEHLATLNEFGFMSTGSPLTVRWPNAKACLHLTNIHIHLTHNMVACLPSFSLGLHAAVSHGQRHLRGLRRQDGRNSCTVSRLLDIDLLELPMTLSLMQPGDHANQCKCSNVRATGSFSSSTPWATLCLFRLRRALQIFEDKSHANCHLDKFKEGLSIYGKASFLNKSCDIEVKVAPPLPRFY